MAGKAGTFGTIQATNAPAAGPARPARTDASPIIGNRARLQLLHALTPAAATMIYRDEAKETAAEIDQRVLKGLVDLVSANPTDDAARLHGLMDLFTSVPQEQIDHVYRRLDPGAPTDDFATYLKANFPQSRADGLGFLRNRVPGGLPGTSAELNANVGEKTAEAANAFGPVGVNFAGATTGKGWYLNPKYWVVKYILRKGNDSHEFIGQTGQPTPLTQLNEFRDANTDWQGPGQTFDIEISFGQFGAALAMKDLFNPGSNEQYGFDCLNAAWLVQLRGRYLAYPEKSRDVDFDRDNKDYVNRFTPSAQTRSNAALFDEIHLPAPIKLSQPNELSAVLKPGDESTISNPFKPSDSAFRNENVVYIGNLHFMGHPFGTFTLEEYAAELKNSAPASKTDQEKIQWVLDNTFIQDISRPKPK